MIMVLFNSNTIMMMMMMMMVADVLLSFCRGGYLGSPVPPTWAIHDEEDDDQLSSLSY